MFGFSETVYRLPSTVLMAIALFLIARLAGRLIHPDAGWFAVFACLTLREINYEAADARPYALGTCVAAAGLWFLVRWLDSARWRDGLLFVGFAALLWPVHLLYWPFYGLFAGYALLRLIRHETEVTWLRAAALFLLLGVALIPVLLHALPLLREAKAHVIVAPPRFRDLRNSYKFLLVLGGGGAAWLVARVLRWPRQTAPAWSAVILILGWWLWHPLCLFVFSRLTGNSVFVERYLSPALPGGALAATLAAAYFIPARHWKPLSAILGAGVVLLMGNVRDFSPPHHNSGWREAAREINELDLGATTPVIYPSPFIEAKWPVWRPDYTLPGFLYCHTLVYPVVGAPYLFPYGSSAEGERYAADLLRGALFSAGRFVIYGGHGDVRLWRNWFTGRPELTGWRNRQLGPFGDVDVALFENPAASGSLGNNAERQLNKR